MRSRWNQKNYWYYYFLAFVEDQSGSIDEALKNYSIAMALNRGAHGSASVGRGSTVQRALVAGHHRYEERPARSSPASPRPGRCTLSCGYLHHELGDFERARREYDRVTESDDQDSIARAARLNRANIDAESGEVERARARIRCAPLPGLRRRGDPSQPGDPSIEDGPARPGREGSERACWSWSTTLKEPGEILAERALARLLSGRITDALDDAAEAGRIHPCPAHDRLWQRVLLSAAPIRPDPARPARGRGRVPAGRQEVERRSPGCGDGLAGRSSGRNGAAYRANLTRAVILAALGKQASAVDAASRALALSRSLRKPI